MTEKKWPERNRFLCEAFVSVGIDPTHIADDSVTVDGYSEFLTDHRGKRIYEQGGEPSTSKVSWTQLPLESALTVLNGYLKDRRVEYPAD